MALLRLISKYVFVYNHFIIAALVAGLIEQSLFLHYLSKLFLSSFPEAKGLIQPKRGVPKYIFLT